MVYSVNTLAQEAALAAITDDQDHIARTRAMVKTGKQILTRTCTKQGMMIRTMTGFRFPGWIRVSMAGEDIMDQFADILIHTLHP